jgi:hypothetical protein
MAYFPLSKKDCLEKIEHSKRSSGGALRKNFAGGMDRKAL